MPRVAMALMMGWLVMAPMMVQAAGDGGMPWDSLFERVTASISGPVAVAILTLAVIGFGFGLAIAANGYILGWGVAIIMGGAIVVSAPTLVSSFFSK